MMPREPLRELVPGETLGTQVMYGDTGILEYGERSIERRERDSGRELETQLGGRHRARGACHRRHHRMASLGESHIVLAKTEFDLTIEFRSGHLITLVSMILSIMITILISKISPGIVRALLVGLVALVGCAPGGSSDLGVSVVATTSIWGDVARHIVGEDGSVEVLAPNGADAHEFRASASQVARLHQADLVIVNGLGLEEGLVDVLDAARADGVNVYEAAPGVDPLPFPGGHDQGQGEQAQGEGEFDPHIWFDPDRVALVAQAIATQLTAIEPSVDWQSRANEYVSELETVSAQIESILAIVPEEDRKLVTNHAALGYFAARYGFEVVGVVIPGGSTLADPSSAELSVLVSDIESEGVKAVFAETTNPSALATAVAGETEGGIAVVDLFTESLGEPGSGAETLAGMLLTDARLIADALS